MKKRMLFCLTFIFVLSVALTAYGANAPSAVKRGAASVVKVTAANDFGAAEVTGIVCDSKGLYVLTDFANVYESKSITVSYGDESAAATVAAVDRDRNIALLKLDMGKRINGTKSARFYCKDAKINSKAYIVNYMSRSDENTIRECGINDKAALSAQELESVDIYMVNTAISREDIFSSLMDKSGNVIGVCLYDGYTSSDKAVTASEAVVILDGEGIKYAKSSPLMIILVTGIAVIAVCLCGALIYTGSKRHRQSKPRLEGLEGEFRGSKIILTKENISIGRDPKYCQIVLLNSPKVSRCHCTVRYDSNRGMFILTDLSSTHGTYLASGERLEANVPKYLEQGSVFKVGDDENVFMLTVGGDEI